MLSGHGGLVELAEGGEEGIALVMRHNEQRTPYDMILLDVHMPNMDGFTFAELVKAHIDLEKTTIMMLTSVGTRGDIARCHELGISSYLVKPVKKYDLFEAMSVTSSRGGHGKLSAGRRPAEVAKAEPGLPLAQADSVNVLLVEDNYVNVKLTTTLLKNRGWNVATASNGLKALIALEKNSFDIILMDVQMPQMDGMEATRRIRMQEKERGGHVPIVAMTAYAMREDRDRCLQAGMDDYVSKPINSKELFAVMERLLGLNPPKDPAAKGSVLLLERMLEVLGGDVRELCELIGDYLAECPNQMACIHDALYGEDARELERAAHSLKGSTLNFCSGMVCDLLYELELIGRSGSLDREAAMAAYGRLEGEMTLLQGQLREYLSREGDAAQLENNR